MQSVKEIASRKKLKGPLLDAAIEICGLSKNHQWKPETWWWYEDVDKALRVKRQPIKVYSALKNEGMTAEANEANTAYIDATRVAKYTAWLAKSEAEKEELATVSPNGAGVFRTAKQIDHTNQDIFGENCVCNDAGAFVLIDKDKMKAWVEHYARLQNVAFQWLSNRIPKVLPTVSSPPQTRSTNHSAKWKVWEPVGSSGIVADNKSCCWEGVELARQLKDAVFSCIVIPSDWEEGFIPNLYEGKLDHGNYCSLKLTDQVIKLPEWVLNFYIREMVNIDEIQFGCKRGRGTIDAIFIVCQLQGKYITYNELLYFAFAGLEQAFGHVPRKVLWWALRGLWVEE